MLLRRNLKRNLGNYLGNCQHGGNRNIYRPQGMGNAQDNRMKINIIPRVLLFDKNNRMRQDLLWGCCAKSKLSELFSF